MARAEGLASTLRGKAKGSQAKQQCSILVYNHQGLKEAFVEEMGTGSSRSQLQEKQVQTSRCTALLRSASLGQ